MKNKMLGYYNYTVILTYMGFLSAFASILVVINGRFRDSIILILFAAVCDMFDGTVASTKERNVSEKRFGIQIDSLSDLVSFGAMPAIFVYMACEKTHVSAVISALFALAALIRLAYFNVSEEERQSTTSEKRKFYYGLPVTGIAVILPIVYIFETKGLLRGPIPYLVSLVVCGTCFLLPFKLKKPDLIGKIILIVIGLAETLGILFIGWDLV